eukprot:6466756-Amphidinium_carterae.1
MQKCLLASLQSEGQMDDWANTLGKGGTKTNTSTRKKIAAQTIDLCCLTQTLPSRQVLHLLQQLSCCMLHLLTQVLGRLSDNALNCGNWPAQPTEESIKPNTQRKQATSYRALPQFHSPDSRFSRATNNMPRTKQEPDNFAKTHRTC